MSLAYLNGQGDGGASGPAVLDDMVIPSNKEFAIFSDKECDGSCGYVQPGTVAYHGFGGGQKAFCFKFKMPSDGSSELPNPDMPAIWTLNALIPLTSQYTKCSCWPECGEFDVYEVLAKGDDKCKSTFHGDDDHSGGSSDYFRRPTGSFIDACVVFDTDSGTVSVKEMDSFDYPNTLSNTAVEEIIGDTSNAFDVAALG